MNQAKFDRNAANRDARAIQHGACNPVGVLNTLLKHSTALLHEKGTQAVCEEPALRLIAHQLAFLFGVGEIENSLTLYGELTRKTMPAPLSKEWVEAVNKLYRDYGLVPWSDTDILLPMTKDELARRAISDAFGYDHALPQQMVDWFADHGADIRGSCVYAYPPGFVAGILFPLSIKVFEEIAKIVDPEGEYKPMEEAE
jgi:hypothetical protein